MYQSELDKVCSEHGIANGDFKDLNRKTAADKLSCNKAFHVAKN